ncbi:glycosyltransferase family 4 protein [Salinibacter ruber]|uniref:glycosyltransferase family 4 protein n=1 Tax=Salinibacter ruber TaxID=146919 RepID=UPI000DD5AFFD|nr:glycosyltransferase family 4 protein [Salinibacter ruber]
MMNSDNIEGCRSGIKVVHMTSTHSAHDPRIWKKECQSLARAGYNVTLIAPNERDEFEGDGHIRAVAPYRSRFERLLLTPLRVYGEALREGGDVYHFHDPELLPYAALLSLKGKRVIYDVHENVVKDLAGRTWIPSSLRNTVSRAFDLCDNRISRLFDGIIAATPGIRQRYDQHSVPSITIFNHPVLSELKPDQPVPYQHRSFQAIYVGSLDEWRGIREIVQAIGRLSAKENSSLAIAGTFESRDFRGEVAEEEGWARVDHRGWSTREEVASLMGQSRCGLVVMHDTPSHREALPVKLFEYMSAGLPVIASSIPKWQSIVEEHRCGLVVDPLDIDEIAAAIEWIFEHPEEAEAMGERGREAVEDQFQWSSQGEKLISFYDKILLQ